MGTPRAVQAPKGTGIIPICKERLMSALRNKTGPRWAGFVLGGTPGAAFPTFFGMLRPFVGRELAPALRTETVGTGHCPVLN